MKVDHPAFNSSPRGISVSCIECPFGDDEGFCEPGNKLFGTCNNWEFSSYNTDGMSCPTEKTYAAACKVADEIIDESASR